MYRQRLLENKQEIDKVNKKIDQVEAEIDQVKAEIDHIKSLLVLDVNDWSQRDVRLYMNHDRLRMMEQQLLEKENYLRKEKDKWLTAQELGLGSSEEFDVMDADYPEFDPLYYQSKNHPCFPFFDVVIEDYLKSLGEEALLARDDNIKQVNEIISNRDLDKYQPIICCTSRGMGKTTFMEAIGMQLVKSNLKNKLIMDALAYGRIISFDFAGAAAQEAIPTEKDIRTFFTRLMIYFLCRMFDGTKVDGIHFVKISSFSDIKATSGSQIKFQKWLRKCGGLDADDMIDEYIRLTDRAFHVECNSPPVFLLDEIQLLSKPTTVPSRYLAQGNKVVYHSFLSLLLTQLAGRHKPVCICTGINNGNIISITEKSNLFPRHISLTTLHKVDDLKQFWSQRTDYLNRKYPTKAKVTGEDGEMIKSLVYASYQVPRLLVLAHNSWFRHKTASDVLDVISPLQAYEDNAIIYYGEIAELLFNSEFTVTDIAHILLCCGVHWKVHDIYSLVPGSKHTWSFLLDNSLIFPYSDNCYLVPFQLIWKAASRQSGDYTRTKAGIEEICESLVPNLDINSLFLSYDGLRTLNLYNLGMCYEKLFASSLAVKYYLRRLEQKDRQFLPILDIYDIGSEDEVVRRSLSSISVDFSSGLYLPKNEAFVNSPNLPCAVIQNCEIHSAHQYHDIILPSKVQGLHGEMLVNIPVSCKASFDLPRNNAIQSQLKTSKENDESVQLLIWLSLGNEKRERKDRENVVLLKGDGCCNGLALDMLVLTKNLISQNNK